MSLTGNTNGYNSKIENNYLESMFVVCEKQYINNNILITQESIYQKSCQKRGGD